jgi:hypothetical protein
MHFEIFRRINMDKKTSVRVAVLLGVMSAVLILGGIAKMLDIL